MISSEEIRGGVGGKGSKPTFEMNVSRVSLLGQAHDVKYLQLDVVFGPVLTRRSCLKGIINFGSSSSNIDEKGRRAARKVGGETK